MILASYYDHIDLTETLIQAGAEVNFKDASGNTALMGVCFKGVVELAEVLINEGADVNLTNAMGASALIFAAMFNRKDMVELLLDNQADKTIRDAKGITALGHAEGEKGPGNSHITSGLESSIMGSVDCASLLFPSAPKS